MITWFSIPGSGITGWETLLHCMQKWTFNPLNEKLTTYIVPFVLSVYCNYNQVLTKTCILYFFVMAWLKKGVLIHPKMSDSLKPNHPLFRSFCLLRSQSYYKHVKYQCSFLITVKLGCKDHGYNEFTTVTSKITDMFGPIWLIYNNLHGYNDVTNIANKYRRSRRVRLTEFECILF